MSARRDEHMMGILLDIAAERGRQDEKWGPDHRQVNSVWGLILTEEVGEAAEAALEVFAPGDSDEFFKAREHLREELVQVAAVAVAWLEALDANRAWQG